MEGAGDLEKSCPHQRVFECAMEHGAANQNKRLRGRAKEELLRLLQQDRDQAVIAGIRQ